MCKFHGAILVALVIVHGLTLMCGTAQAQPMSDGEACLEGSGAAVLDEAYCRRALSQSDLAAVERAALLVARAGALANLRETQAALAEVSHALSLNPASATAYFLRGLLRSDNAAALADMDQAIALNPYFIAALAQRGKVHFQHGRLGLAAADFDRALAIQPRSSAALFFKGVLFFIKANLPRQRRCSRGFCRCPPCNTPWPSCGARCRWRGGR